MKTSKPVCTIILIFILFTFTGCALPTSMVADVSPNGKIAFLRNNQIFTMNPDGSDVTQITHDITIADIDYTWSPDKQKFAFSALLPIQNEDVEIFVVNSDGSEQAQLTKSMHPSTNPRWSPDGKKIAFFSSRDNENGYPDIYIINADGTGQYRLTNTSGIYGDFSWSPNGTQIAYNYQGDIFVINLDGNKNINITNTKTPQGEAYPVWSPDGKKILFLSYIADGTYIEQMNTDGSGRKKLTDDSHVGEGSFSWSPDGKNIVFISGIDIYAVSSGGGAPRNLTHLSDGKFCLFPTWSPDGQWISFSCGYVYPVDPSGNQQIFIIKADGENLTGITNPKENSGRPIWSP